MKKLLAVILALSMSMSLVGCSFIEEAVEKFTGDKNKGDITIDGGHGIAPTPGPGTDAPEVENTDPTEEKTDEAPELTGDELLAKLIESAAKFGEEVTDYKGTMDYTVKMGLGNGEESETLIEIAMDMDMHVSSDNGIVAARYDGNMNVGGLGEEGTMPLSMITVTDKDGKVVTYTKAEDADTWISGADSGLEVELPNTSELMSISDEFLYKDCEFELVESDNDYINIQTALTPEMLLGDEFEEGTTLEGTTTMQFKKDDLSLSGMILEYKMDLPMSIEGVESEMTTTTDINLQYSFTDVNTGEKVEIPEDAVTGGLNIEIDPSEIEVEPGVELVNPDNMDDIKHDITEINSNLESTVGIEDDLWENDAGFGYLYIGDMTGDEAVIEDKALGFVYNVYKVGDEIIVTAKGENKAPYEIYFNLIYMNGSEAVDTATIGIELASSTINATYTVLPEEKCDSIKIVMSAYRLDSDEIFSAENDFEYTQSVNEFGDIVFKGTLVNKNSMPLRFYKVRSLVIKDGKPIYFGNTYFEEEEIAPGAKGTFELVMWELPAEYDEILVFAVND